MSIAVLDEHAAGDVDAARLTEWMREAAAVTAATQAAIVQIIESTHEHGHSLMATGEPDHPASDAPPELVDWVFNAAVVGFNAVIDLQRAALLADRPNVQFCCCRRCL